MRNVLISLILLASSTISLSSQTSIFARTILANNSGQSMTLIAAGVSQKVGKSTFEVRGFRNLNLRINGFTASYSRNVSLNKLGGGFILATNMVAEVIYLPKPDLGTGMMGGNILLAYIPSKNITVGLIGVGGATHNSKNNTGYTLRGIMSVSYKL